MDLLLLSLPWLLLGLTLIVLVRLPPRIPASTGSGGEEVPLVSIIVPARNEEVNLPALLSSLTRLEYPRYEVLVVDDESRDRTRELVLAADPGNAESLRLIPGRPLPEGWFGKPWACHQGAMEARGSILLFTDADTVHDPGLLAQSMACLAAEEADVLTLVGRQVMASFWEQLLQPQFFMLLAVRFPRSGTPKRPDQWKGAIANGQYLLFRRRVYEAFGGHERVRGEVVEDMRIAQLLVRDGWKLLVREGSGLRTRMYRSFRGLAEGWSKNFTTGVFQTTPRWLHPVILPVSLLLGTTLWLLPPGVLIWALGTGSGGLPLEFGAATTGFGVLYWGIASGIMRGNPLYGLLFPLGSLLAAGIFLRSWVRGGQIRWKGRDYTVEEEARRGDMNGRPAGFGKGPSG